MLYVELVAREGFLPLSSASTKPLHIGILGSRGIPNRYGGFEAFAENLSQRLVERGYRVSVYCRRSFSRPGDDDLIDPRIQRVVLPSIPAKHLDTPVHTFLSVLHAIFTDADVILMVNVANSPLAWIPRLFGKPVVLNVDGLDRKRRKWGWFASSVLYLCELFSLVTPTRVVTDGKAVQEYYRHRYGKRSTMIGYGAEVPRTLDAFDLTALGLKPGDYILYVSRMEPENNPELVIRAYKKMQTDWPLVMVGSNSYDPQYDATLRSLADRRVIFTGPVYGAGYWELQKNAGTFVFACEVGGIHPALIEAMAAGRPMLYLDTESNRETAAGCGVNFSNEGDLAAKLAELISDPNRRSALGASAARFAAREYSWDKVTEQYEELFHEMLPRCPTSMASRRAGL